MLAAGNCDSFLRFHNVFSMGGAFQKKLVRQNGSLAECSTYMLRYENKSLNAEMSTNMTVLHG